MFGGIEMITKAVIGFNLDEISEIAKEVGLYVCEDWGGCVDIDTIDGSDEDIDLKELSKQCKEKLINAINTKLGTNIPVDAVVFSKEKLQNFGFNIGFMY